MTVAKDIINTLAHLINTGVAPDTKIWRFSLLTKPFESMTVEGKCWLTNLGVNDWGLGKRINISISKCKSLFTQKHM